MQQLQSEIENLKMGEGGDHFKIGLFLSSSILRRG
jgi:hypothetical protein